MKILLVQGSAERAGAERMLYYLLKFMDTSKFQPSVLFLADGPFVEEVCDLNVEVMVRPAPTRLREISSWDRAIQTIRAAIQETSPEVLHANGEKMTIFASRAAKAEKLPTIGWLHDAPSAGGIAGRLAQRALVLNRPTQVVTCARWLANAFNAKLHLGAVAVVNGLDLSSLPLESDVVSRIKKEQGWASGTMVVSHFARLQRWKGHEVFLRAAALLTEKFPDLRFLIVGDTMYGREAGYGDFLRGLCSDLGLDGRALFTGFRADALEIMCGSDLVAHCSIQKDPFPTVILEAMGMGKAVVATKSGGPEEALQDGVTGLLVESGNHVDLAASIEAIVVDRRLRDSLGEAAKKDAYARFSGRRMAAEFEDLYGKLASDDLARHRSPR